MIDRRLEVTFAHANEVVAKVDRFELIDNHRGATRSVLLIEGGRVRTRHQARCIAKRPHQPRSFVAITLIVR